MTDTVQRAAGPGDAIEASIARMIERRHDPTEPSAAERQAEDERRRLDRRQRDNRNRNRALWADHHRHLAEALSERAEHHRQQAQLLEGVR